MEWLITNDPVPYNVALTFMEKRVAEIKNGTAEEVVWLLEHPPLYTAGTSANTSDLLEPQRLPVYKAGRGGQYTYHGPGQRVAYTMIDLKKRGDDVKQYVHDLEEWIIHCLNGLGVAAERRDGRVGVYDYGQDGACGPRPPTGDALPRSDVDVPEHGLGRAHPGPVLIEAP